MKKLLSLLLCLGLLLSLCCLPALADMELPEASAEDDAVLTNDDLTADLPNGDDDAAKPGNADENDDAAKPGNADEDDDPVKPGDADEDDDPAKPGDADEDDDPVKPGDANEDNDPVKPDDANEDNDPVKPDDDPAKVEMNVFYYSLEDSLKPLVLLSAEYVEPGGHPCSVPPVVGGGPGVEWTWYLSPDLTGDPVDPTTFTVENDEDILNFYGMLDTVRLRLHMPAGTVINGNEIDVFNEVSINRGDPFYADSYGVLPTGYWAAGWADADGNLIDTDTTRFYEDADLWAVEGNFRVTYILGEEQPIVERPWEVAVSGGSSVQFSGEGFLEPGTPRHVPTQYLQVTIKSYPVNDTVQEWIDIVGWVDEDGNPVDPASLTITEDRTFYALYSPKPGTEPDIALNEDGTMAFVTGSFDGLYARLSISLDNNGESGLYIAQVEIQDNGEIEISPVDIPGLTVLGVSIALVPSPDDITTPKPNTVAWDYVLF